MVALCSGIILIAIVLSVLTVACVACGKCSKKKEEEMQTVDENPVYGVYQLGENYERQDSTNEVVDNNLYYEQ